MSPDGAGDGSPKGSEKVYTEAELQEHVGKSQSSLQSRLNEAEEARKDAEQRADEAEALEDEIDDLDDDDDDDGKDKSEKVSEVRRRRSLEAREKTLDERETQIERESIAKELNISPDVLKDATKSDLRTIRTVYGAKPAEVKESKPEERTPSRQGGTGTNPTLDSLIALDVSKMSYPEVLKHQEAVTRARQ